MWQVLVYIQFVTCVTVWQYNINHFDVSLWQYKKTTYIISVLNKLFIKWESRVFQTDIVLGQGDLGLSVIQKLEGGQGDMSNSIFSKTFIAEMLDLDINYEIVPKTLGFSFLKSIQGFKQKVIICNTADFYLICVFDIEEGGPSFISILFKDMKS